MGRWHFNDTRPYFIKIKYKFHFCSVYDDNNSNNNLNNKTTPMENNSNLNSGIWTDGGERRTPVLGSRMTSRYSTASSHGIHTANHTCLLWMLHRTIRSLTMQEKFKRENQGAEQAVSRSPRERRRVVLHRTILKVLRVLLVLHRTVRSLTMQEGL